MGPFSHLYFLVNGVIMCITDLLYLFEGYKEAQTDLGKGSTPQRPERQDQALMVWDSTHVSDLQQAAIAISDSLND